MSESTITREIDTFGALKRLNGKLSNSVIQGLDLSDLDWSTVSYENTVFLGCTFPSDLSPCELVNNGAVIFPDFPKLPFNPYRGRLYTREELTEGWSPEEDNSKDLVIYNHFSRNGKHNVGVMDLLAMRLHDHAIDDALTDLLEGRREKDGKKKVIGVMGGHSTSRKDPYFTKVALMTRQLTKDGYYREVSFWKLECCDSDLVLRT